MSRSRSSLRAVETIQAPDRRRRGRRSVLELQQYDGRELTPGRQRQRIVHRCGGRRRTHDDDGVVADGRKILVEVRIPPQGVFDDGGVRPLNLNMLSDQQSIIIARSNRHYSHNLAAIPRALLARESTGSERI